MSGSNTPFNFGAPLGQTNSQTTQTGLTFNPSKTTQTTMFNINATSQSQAPFTLNTGVNTATSSSVAPVSFAPTAATAPALNFGAWLSTVTTTTPSMSLTTSSGAPPTAPFSLGTTSTPAPALFNNTTASVSSTTAAPVFPFTQEASTPASTITTPATSVTSVVTTLTFGNTTTTATATTTAPALVFSTTPSIATGGITFSKPVVTAVTTSSLFGVGTGATVLGASTTTPATQPVTTATLTGFNYPESTSQSVPLGLQEVECKIKYTTLPEEVGKLVEVMKQHIKTQKSISSQNNRTSFRKLANISAGFTSLEKVLREISDAVNSNAKLINDLRTNTTRTLQNLEMAQFTHSTPPSLQYENTTPLIYFRTLINKYEIELVNIHNNIAIVEKHMQSLAVPEFLTPENFKNALNQINQSFISLAGRMYCLHQATEEKKDLYKSLRKSRNRQPYDVFATIDTPPKTTEGNSVDVACGPTPFMKFAWSTVLNKPSNSGASRYFY